MRERFVRAVCTAAMVALTAAPLNGSAASSGLAWDSVTKLAMGADISTLQPGSFDQDFAAASSGQSGGGLLSQMMGGNMQQLMNRGLAERHYVAGSLERTDQLAAGTATIVDCTARTITTLDLRKKTYRVVSMDAASAAGAAGGGEGAPPRDNGASFAIAVNNTALGARQVGGVATKGYSSQVTITVTRGSGESRTQNGSFVAYYASFPTPTAQCARGAYPEGVAAGGGPGAMAIASRLMRALSSANADKRFSVTQSGPALPLGSFTMYEAMSLKGGGYSPAFITERGNVRPLDANDPIFSVPTDFTKQQ